MNTHLCGVCWREKGEGLLFPSGTRRPDGVTPCDNFICTDCVRPGLVGMETAPGNVFADKVRPRQPALAN
jgi:hypothetical protein